MDTKDIATAIIAQKVSTFEVNSFFETKNQPNYEDYDVLHN